MEKLVSLITPCYNAEKYISRFLDSVMVQSYKRIQFIIVNDGSSDKTLSIIKHYEPILRSKLEEYIILDQKNSGPSSAVNSALKYVKGTYLCWADSDDVLKEDNILLKAKFLDDNPQCALVVCQAEARFDDNSQTPYILENIPSDNDDIFEKLLNRDVGCYPGTFMVRTELLWKRYPDREIYHHRRVGQNYQLLLPIAYKNRCGCIDDILYEYHIRSDSHSHLNTYDEKIADLYIREQVLDKILDFLPPDIKMKYFVQQKRKCCQERMKRSFVEHDVEEFNINCTILKESGIFDSYIEKMIKVIETDKRINLYGFGEIGRDFYSHWSERIDIVIDNYSEDKSCVTFWEFINREYVGDNIFVIASGNYKETLNAQVLEYYPNAQVICL